MTLDPIRLRNLKHMAPTLNALLILAILIQTRRSFLLLLLFITFQYRTKQKRDRETVF